MRERAALSSAMHSSHSQKEMRQGLKMQPVGKYVFEYR